MLLPIVRTEQDIFVPAYRGSEVAVHLSLLEIGRSSFRLNTELYTEVHIGTIQMVHVAVDPGTKKSIEIPRELRALLLTLKGVESVGNLKAGK